MLKVRKVAVRAFFTVARAWSPLFIMADWLGKLSFFQFSQERSARHTLRQRKSCSRAWTFQGFALNSSGVSLVNYSRIFLWNLTPSWSRLSRELNVQGKAVIISGGGPLKNSRVLSSSRISSFVWQAEGKQPESGPLPRPLVPIGTSLMSNLITALSAPVVTTPMIPRD